MSGWIEDRFQIIAVSGMAVALTLENPWSNFPSGLTATAHSFKFYGSSPTGVHRFR
jgi:hypothetical protein